MVENDINLKLDVKAIKEQFNNLLHIAYIENDENRDTGTIQDNGNEDLLVAQARISALYNSKKMHSYQRCSKYVQTDRNTLSCNRKSNTIINMNDKENIPVNSYSGNTSNTVGFKSCREPSLNLQKRKDKSTRETKKHSSNNSHKYYENEDNLKEVSLIYESPYSIPFHREFRSTNHLRDSDVFHSTFNYPLHSTMNQTFNSPISTSTMSVVNDNTINNILMNDRNHAANIEKNNSQIREDSKVYPDKDCKTITKHRKLIQICEKILSPASVLCEKQKKILKTLYKKHLTLSNQSLLNAIELDENIDYSSDNCKDNIDQQLFPIQNYFKVLHHMTLDIVDPCLNPLNNYSNSLYQEEEAKQNKKNSFIKDRIEENTNSHFSNIDHSKKILQNNENENKLENKNIKCRNLNDKDRAQIPVKHVSFYSECSEKSSLQNQDVKFNCFIPCVSGNQKTIRSQNCSKGIDEINSPNYENSNYHIANKIAKNDNLIEIYSCIDDITTPKTEQYVKVITYKRKRALMKKMKKFNESMKYKNPSIDSSIYTLAYF